MRKQLSLLLIIAFIAVAPLARSADLPKLRVAIMPYLLSVPTYYMMENGLDVKNGFKIESSVYTTGVPMSEALGASLWDIGTGGPSAVFGIANFGAKVIANIDLCTGGTGAFVRKDSAIAQIKDKLGPNIYGDAATLKGATVLVPVGSLNQLNVMKWLEAAGLEPSDASFVQMDNSTAFQAFKAGQGDIVPFSPPLTYIAVDEGWVNGASGEDLGMYVWDPLLANPRTLDEKMPEIVKYVRIMYEVFDMFTADPELFAEWSVKWQAANGATVKIENARLEVAARPFVTTEMAKTMPVGETIYDMAVFFNQIGTLEDEDLAKVRPNLTDEVIKKVFAK